MDRNLDVEYCKNCDDIYATNASIWLLFGDYGGETTSSNKEIFNCPRCNLPILRYDGYLEALKRQDSTEFVDELLSNITDLSDDSLSVLQVLITNFAVPSFATILKGDSLHIMTELERKRYVKAEVASERTVVTLNAFKLGLMDSKPILMEMAYQRNFINYPEYLSNKDTHYLRRKERINSLVNDFTECDKDYVLTYFDGKCALTGKDVPIHFDHVIPVAIGHGGTTKANMLPIWQRINSSKGARNIFEWFEEKGEEYSVCPSLFEKAIEYLASLNEMTVEEYRGYVYECHANPNDNLTEVMSND